jgi:hypothetical protein
LKEEENRGLEFKNEVVLIVFCGFDKLSHPTRKISKGERRGLHISKTPCFQP